MDSPAPGKGFRRSRTFVHRAVRSQVAEERAKGGAELERQMLLAQLARPKMRWQCAEGERPCPFVTCRHHLALEVTTGGGLKLYHPESDLEDLPDTCALDVAERGGITLDEVAKRLNVTRERVRQVETIALKKFRKRMTNAARDLPGARGATGA